MNVTFILADYAQAAEGKLNLIGAGWTICGPGPVHLGLGLICEIPWNEANRKHSFEIHLEDEDGVPVPGIDPVRGDVEAGRPPGLLPGTSIVAPMALNCQNLQLEPGRRYVWVLKVNGKGRAEWRLSFATRPDAMEGVA